MQLDIQIIILKETMTVQNRNNSVQLSGQRGKDVFNRNYSHDMANVNFNFHDFIFLLLAPKKHDWPEIAYVIFIMGSTTFQHKVT